MIPPKRTPTSREVYDSAWAAIKKEVTGDSEHLLAEGWKTVAMLGKEMGKSNDCISSFCTRRVNAGRMEKTNSWSADAQRVVSYFRPLP